ncbi:hypothetical protein MFIFM68171_00864 [Madurella fahalii]|uniref:Tryptophan synthase beta chain-like PALP domain-containing protein n=1 Tax=Madurella fahalii TaxID=1157608 RepID=A0ABQ0FYS1_9PEZI
MRSSSISSSPIYLNPAARGWRHGSCSQPQSESPVQALHRSLPNYAPSPLHSLPSLAQSLNLSHVFLKDESSRFGLPSFKILGASWAVYRAVAARLGLDPDCHIDSGLSSLASIAKQRGLGNLITCTEGNWGRAVARMAGYLGLKAVVYVPGHVHVATRDLIRGEGAEVRVVEGADYDAALETAKRRGEDGDEGLLVMDIGWEGYEDVPQWVVEGYQTMLDEADGQVLLATGGKPVTHAIVPVGCGSIAQAVTQHFKNAARERDSVPPATVLAVEPDTAACLKTSLEQGRMTTVATQDSIMCGMNCGTLSTTAWPALRSGVDGTVVVSDGESHAAVGELGKQGIRAGPCGAATLAALKRVCESGGRELGLDGSSVVVLFCTEGHREYAVPA